MDSPATTGCPGYNSLSGTRHDLGALTMSERAKLCIFFAAPSALLTDHRPHGDGLVAFGFLSELASRGHELHVAAQRIDVRTQLPPNVHLHALGGAGRVPPLARLAFMRGIRRLYGRLEQTRRFDVVHQLIPVEVGVSLALADKRVPVVLGPYVPDWPAEPSPALLSFATPWAKQVLRAAQQRRAGVVLLSSPAAASKLSGAAARRLLVGELSPGIDDRLFVPGRGGAGQDVLFLASLEPRKGIHVAIDAFARLSADLPEARLLVAGTGSEADAVRGRVEALRASDRISLLGAVERDRVSTTMQSCDVYCLPSFGEPFGMTALEAMACARPVVGTDAGGLRHLISERGGRRVPPGDPQALAEALRELLTQPGLRRAMGEHNRSLVEDRYRWSRVADRLEGYYRDAMSRQGHSPTPARTRTTG